MTVRRAAGIGALLLLAATSCARRRPVFVPAEPAVTTGIASWYGPGFHGKKTANGERFDQDALTAAHCCWPLGMRAKVTLLSTDKSVIVWINDRMPPNRKGRVIDLSRGAARRIGLIGPGTGRVRLEPVP